MKESSRAPAPSYVTLPRLEAPPPTVLDYLIERFPHVTPKAWQERVTTDAVHFDVDGEVVTPETPYRPQARVRYFRAVPVEPSVPFSEKILYRDDRLLVVDKPHFLPVTPGGPYVNACLLYRLRRSTGLPDVQPVHRLDRDTAGLVLFAVDAAACRAYGRLFQEAQVKKEYLAVARLLREPEARSWRVENRLVRGEPWFRMKIVDGPPNAVTELELVDRRDDPEHGPLGLFRLRPRSGKKHQLRVHLAELGFPVLYDRYYPELQAEAPPDHGRPLQLLASGLGFRDPFGGGEVSFRSRLRLLWPRFT